MRPAAESIVPERVALLRGEGRFLDDISAPDAAHLAFVRSPHAHATILRVDTAAAGAAPGVLAVLTGADVASRVGPIRACLEPGPGDVYRTTHWHPVATQRVRYVGEIVAVVAATSPSLARDAAQQVQVDYAPLPAVTDAGAARAAGAARVHDDVEDNVLFRARRATPAQTAADPFPGAPITVRIHVRHPRVAGVSMEGAGALATPDPASGEIAIVTSTQIPHLVRDGLSACLGVPENLLRVSAPDVGGGFGPKAQLHPEEILVTHLARTLGRAVKWVQDRGEHLAAGFHARDAQVDAEMATDANGTILGVRARALFDVGAYSSFPFTCSLEPQTMGAGLAGPYRVPWIDYEGLAVATNKFPGGAYRGVGFPMCPLVLETLLDRVAHAIGVDPAEVRRRNLIRADELPRRSPTGALYDSGDYPALLALALERADYEGLRRAQRDAAPGSRRVGVGISSFIEFSAMNRMVFRLRGMTHIPGYDSALVRVTRSGAVQAYVSTPSQGQGQHGTFARVLADVLEVAPQSLRIVLGDTAVTPYGSGTFASRSLVSGGGALRVAARRLIDRMRELTAMLWQVPIEDLAYAAGAVHLSGDPSRRLSIGELGELVHSARQEFPPGWEPGLEAKASYDPPGVPVTPATHVAVVEVDTDTGTVRLVRYVVAEDCGPVVDHEVVDGQVRGAVAQAIGAALREEVHYDASGQLVSGSLMDYAIPGATDVPGIEVAHLYTPSPFTEGGYKGMAEGGTIGGPAAIVNAVADALGVLPDRVRLPLTPERVLGLLPGLGSGLSR